MRIAIPLQKEKIAMHFTGTTMFRFYEVEQGRLLRTFEINSGAANVEETAKFLRMAGTHMIICGGIGGSAVKALYDNEIMIMGGILGDANEKICEFLAGALAFQPMEKHSHLDGEECHCGH